MAIPNHIIEEQIIYEELLLRYFDRLSKRSQTQLHNALRQPTNKLWDEYLWPNLLLSSSADRLTCGAQWQTECDAAEELSDRPIYLPVSHKAKFGGRNQSPTLHTLEQEQEQPQGGLTYFTNFLRGGVQNREGRWDAPKDRVCVGPFVVFTIEYDPPSEWPEDKRIKFLDTQLGWFRKSGSNDLDRPIRPIWDWASRYVDFRGMSACYSGNKSVHIHCLFETQSIIDQEPSLSNVCRAAYIDLFNSFSKEVERIFPVHDLQPDPALRLPEQYRKLPNGVLTVENTNHLFGVPKGSRIPLCSLWEKFVSRASKGAKKRFVSIERLTAAKTKHKGNRTPNFRRKSLIGSMTPDEHAFCSDQFNKLVERCVGKWDYPKGVGLEYQSGEWKGLLLATDGDVNPNTIILENRAKSFTRGGKKADRQVNIGLPLRFQINRWRNEYSKKTGRKSQKTPAREAAQPDAVKDDPNGPQSRAETIAEAREQLTQVLGKLLNAPTTALLQAPEGIGKTTVLMEMVKETSDELIKSEISKLDNDEYRLKSNQVYRRPSLFAFTSYELAEEKAKQFNECHSGSEYVGIVLPSFSQTYSQARSELGIEGAISPSIAGQNGCRSVAQAIHKLTPKIWDRMKVIHSKTHSSYRRRRRTVRPVYFSAHQVMHRWNASGITAAFAHPKFFQTPHEEWWRLSDEMRLRIAVHDELSRSHLLDAHRSDHVEWYWNMIEADSDLWSNSAGLKERYGAFNRHMNRTPIKGLTFETCLDIHRIGYSREDRVTVDPYEEYGEPDGHLYSNMHGNCWYARPQDWWSNLGERTILLTTESLPTEMMRELSSRTTVPSECVTVETVLSGEGMSDPLEVQRLQSCKSSGASMIIESIRDAFDDPELFFISDRARDIQNTATHMGIRGSNKLIGRNVAQIAFYKSPDEYEQLQLINAVFRLKAAICLSHVDQINQSAGRNLGFRQLDGKQAKHYLFVSNRLWKQIHDTLLYAGRYSLDVVESNGSRKNRRLRKKLAAQRQGEANELEIAELIDEYERGEL